MNQVRISAVAGSQAIAEEILHAVAQIFGEELIAKPHISTDVLSVEEADLFLCFKSRVLELGATLPAEKVLGIDMIPYPGFAVELMAVPGDEMCWVFCNSQTSARVLVNYCVDSGFPVDKFAYATYDDTTQAHLVEILREARYIIGVSPLVSCDRILHTRFGEFLRPDCKIIAVDRTLSPASISNINQWLDTKKQAANLKVLEQNRLLLAERENAEKKSKLMELLLLRVFNASSAIMAIFTVPDYRCLTVNDACLKTFAFRREEVIGRTPEELNVVVDKERWLQLKRHFGHNQVMNDAQIRTKNGELRDLLLSLSKIEVEGVTCALVAGTDVTNLKHMEKELARLDRLNIVGEIAASIGHEVRNPLTTVRGYLQFLSKKEEFTSFSAQFNLMVEELDRANGIITDFLSLAKDKKLELEPLNLNDIIDNLLPLLNADALLAGHQVIFEKRAIPDLNLDGKEIRQFIFNLVRNSFEAMVPGGQVRIQTLSDAKSVILSVTDTGHGIPSAILDQLGTPFVTTKPNGTGLGLSVCYRIAQRHNAKIEVKSSSAGTSFIVKFRVH